MRIVRVSRREMHVSCALCATLLSGCSEAASEVDVEFSLAQAAAAVGFAEAELATSSPTEATSVEVEEAVISVTPARRRRVLYFTAAWCQTCRANAPTLAALAAAGWSVGTSERDHIQIVDVDASSSIANAYNVRSVPQWVLIEDEVAMHRTSGVLDPFAVGRLFERDE